jgi:predicted RNA-binding protein associated with RNAse of E/G family
VRIHYHRPGRGTIVFHEDLVLDRPDVKVTLLREYAGDAARAGNHRILDAGAPIVWFVFPHLWRDVGRFHLADGRFTGWYTNLRRPPRMDGADWHCTDLFLDHWIPADGGPAVWLDEDELAAARAQGLVTAEDTAGIAAERTALDRLTAVGQWPPDICREMTLAHALDLIVG